MRHDKLRGSVFYRPGHLPYVVSYPLPAHLDERDANGKRLYKKLPQERYATEQEAHARLVELNYQHNTGTLRKPDQKKLADFLAEWLETKTDLAYATRVYYRRSCGIVSRYLGRYELRQLDTLIIQRWHRDMTADPDLSTHAARNAHILLSRALKAAVNADRIPHNVANRVPAPRHRAQRRDAWQPDEASRFVAFISNPDNMYRIRMLGSSFWLVMIYSGLRVSEALALPWSALDMQRSRLTVDRTGGLIEDGSYGIKDAPKSAAGIRAVPLPASVMAALRSHRASQNEQRLRMGRHWQDRDLIWTRDDGSLVGPVTARYQLDTLIRRAGLPRITPHGLRHTAGSLMLENGVPLKTVQELLGHASASTTLDIYGHSSERSKEDAIDRLDDLLGGNG